MVTLVNRAKMSTSTTGTGTITLGSAVSGYQDFATAGVANGDTVSYTIEDGTDFECGKGTYTSTGTTLSRDTITDSSNSGSAITLSGSAEVFLTVLVGVTTDFSFVRSTNDTAIIIGRSAGSEAGYSDGTYSIKMGGAAGRRDQGNYNIGLGYLTVGGYNTNPYSVTGGNNLGIGYVALGGVRANLNSTNMTGDHNFGIGSQSFYSLTTGHSNIGIGPSTGSLVQTGQYNVLLGRSSGSALGTGSNNNVILGSYSAGSSTSESTYVGNAGGGGAGYTTYAKLFGHKVQLGPVSNGTTALSGTSWTVDSEDAGAWTGTLTGNTTVTLNAKTTNTGSYGVVQSTSMVVTQDASTAYTITWPASVKWEGGTAPDAPATGETDVYSFITLDNGTNWYAFHAGDAMA